MRRGITCLFLLVLLAACRPTEHRVLFAGDSNTKFMACSYPAQWQALHDPVAVQAYNDAIFGSTAFTWLDDGVLRARLQADQPTEVVIALGTNDIAAHGRSARVVMTDLMALYQQAATFELQKGGHPRVFLATIPLIYDPPDTTGWQWSTAAVAGFDSQIKAANAFLRMNVPAGHLIDFDSWMPATWTHGFLWSDRDGIHIGCDAHTVRSRMVEAAVFGATG